MTLRVIEEASRLARAARGMGMPRRCVSKWVRQHRVRHIKIKPHHPQQNGKVKLYNQTL